MGPYGGSHRSSDVRGLLTLAVAAGVAVPGVVLTWAVVHDGVLLAVVVGGGLLIAGAGAVALAAWFVWRAVDAQRAHERDRVMLARAVDLLARGRPDGPPMIDVSALDDAGDAGRGGEIVTWPTGRRGGASW